MSQEYDQFKAKDTLRLLNQTTYNMDMPNAIILNEMMNLIIHLNKKIEKLEGKWNQLKKF